MLSAFPSSPSLVHGESGEEVDEEDVLNGLPVSQCVCMCHECYGNSCICLLK